MLSQSVGWLGTLPNSSSNCRGHVWGIGTLWDRNDIFPNSPNTGFVDEEADLYVGPGGMDAPDLAMSAVLAEWERIGCDATVGVPLQDGAGHWDENCLDEEVRVNFLCLESNHEKSSLLCSPFSLL